MKNKGFGLVGILVVIAVIAGGYYYIITTPADIITTPAAENNLINEEGNICNLDYVCKNQENLSKLNKAKCEIKNSQVGISATIRIQGVIKEEWDKNQPSVKEIVQEIICKENPDNMRMYFIGSLRKYSSINNNWSKQDLVNVEDPLLRIIGDGSESFEIRSGLINELSRTYGYMKFSSSEANNIFNILEKLIKNKEDTASVAKAAISGVLADIDLSKSKSILESYK